MDVVHRGDQEQVLAAQVELADGLLAKAVGRMGRAPLEPGKATVFRFDTVAPRRVHTLFVRGALDVIWVARERVTHTATLQPWRIGPRYGADTVVELPAGEAAEVSAGDRILLRRGPDRFK